MDENQSTSKPLPAETEMFENRVAGVFGWFFILILNYIVWSIIQIPRWVGYLVHKVLGWMAILILWILSRVFPFSSGAADDVEDEGEAGI